MSGAAPQNTAPPASGELVFKDEPLPVDVLRMLDLTADLSIGEFRSRDLVARDLAIVLSNGSGMTRLETSFNGIDGGSAEAAINLDFGSATPELDLSAEFADVRLNVMSGDIDDPSQLPPIGLALALDLSGATPHAMAAGADGRVVLTMGPGLIENSAVGIVSGDIIAQLFSALNPFAAEEQYSSLDCTVVALTVEDGIGRLDPMLMQTEKLQIVGGGDIEFDTEALNIEFNTKPRAGIGITADMFVTPFVRLSGTLAEPGVGMNARGAILQGGAAVLTGGISLLLGGLADRATAEADQCETALTAANDPAQADSED